MAVDDNMCLRILLEVFVNCCYHLIRDSLISIIEACVDLGSFRGTWILHLEKVKIFYCVDTANCSSEYDINTLSEAIISDIPLHT
jgi:hypothetical protein